MRNFLLSFLVYLVVLFLLAAGLQGLLGIVKERGLYGEVPRDDRCPYSLDSLSSGEFQQCVTEYANNHMGFRNSLIRVSNQATFSLLGTSPANNIILGKHRNLFETDYINSYQGKDFVGRTAIAARVKRLLNFQELLERQQVHFILAFCPSKVRYMPENLPAQFRSPGEKTNYDTYLDVISKEGRGLHFIDFNRYFSVLKDSAPFPLYPKGGVHWSNISSRYYALDSLLRYMERLGGQRYPRLVTERIRWSDTILTPDNDLSELLNLLYPYPAGSLAYGVFRVDSAGAVKPSVLAIGDSYYWEIFGFEKIGSIFGTHDFWAWNKSRYPVSKYEKIRPDDFLFLKQDLLSHNFVILMVTETNLPTLLDFDEKTYAMFDPDNPLVKELQRKRAERIAFFKGMILNDPKWSASVRDKAKARHISFEEMLQIDAEYMVNYELNQQGSR